MTKADAARATDANQVPSAIELRLNGQLMQLVASNVAEAVAAAGYTDDRFATALNGTFVPRERRAQTPVAAGDAIEVLTARQGG